MLPLIDGEITVNGVTLKIANGKIKLNGTASATTWISVLPSIKSGTTTDNQTPLFNSQDMNYTVSIQNIEGQISNASNFYFTMLINENQQSIDIMNRTSSTIDFTNKNLYAIWFLINNGTTFNNYEFNAQIEEGSTATSYIQHQEQTFTFPLGNEKLMLGDYLADDGIHHVRGQFTMNENTLIASSAYGINSYVVTLSNRAVSNETDLLFISSHFKGIPANQRGTAPNVIYSNTAKQAEIRNTEFSTLATFKEWLEENNPVVEYVLETEQVVPYTTAQQEVYNQIKQSISYEEQTNIIGASAEANPIFEVKAFRNMNTSIESLQSRIELLKGRS